MKIGNYSKYDFLSDGTILSKTNRPIKGRFIEGRNFVALVGDDGKYHTKARARWILMAFTDKNEWKEHAHHKNGNRLDDRLENLQWINRNEHIKIHYGKIVGVNINTNESFVYDNETDASKKLNIPIQEISRVILGERFNTHGYWFTKIKLGGSPTS